MRVVNYTVQQVSVLTKHTFATTASTVEIIQTNTTVVSIDILLYTTYLKPR